MKILRNPEPPARIYFPFCLEAAAYGLTLGLYLFLYGEFIKAGSETTGFADLFFSVLTFSILLFEPITGYVADRVGRSVSIRWSYVLRSTFFLLLFCAWWIGPSSGAWSWFEGLVLGSAVVFAASYTLRSGARDAWLHDSLWEIGRGSSYTRIYAMGYNFQSACFIGGSLAGVRLQDAPYPGSELGFAHVSFLAGAIVCLITHLVLYLAMDDPRRYQYPGSREIFRGGRGGTEEGVLSLLWGYVPNLWRSLHYVCSRGGLLVLTVAGGVALLLVDASDFLWRALWTDRQFVSLWVVLVVGATPAGNFVTTVMLNAYRRRAGREVSIAVLTYMTITYYAVLGVVTIVAARGGLDVTWLVVLMQLTRGLYKAPQSGVLNAWIESSHPMRATILSTIEAIRNGIEGLAFLAVAVRLLGAEPFSETLEGWVWPAAVLFVVLTPFGFSRIRVPRAPETASSA